MKINETKTTVIDFDFDDIRQGLILLLQKKDIKGVEPNQIIFNTKEVLTAKVEIEVKGGEK